MQRRPIRWIGKLGIGLLFVAGLPAVPAVAQRQDLAVTFDDLPVHDPLPPGVTTEQVALQIITALRTAGAPPTFGFLNGSNVRAEGPTLKVLQMWRQAGLPLGNHTWSHMDIATHTAQEFEADVLRNEPLLQQFMGDRDWRWLRFPYHEETGDPAKSLQVRAFLGQHGYRVAAITAYFNDLEWNAPYARCVARHDAASVAWLEDSYLEAAAKELDRGRQMGQTLRGHTIPLVLLLHFGAFDAHMLPRLLAYYRAHDVRLVTLEEAERSSFYRADIDMKASSPNNLERALIEKHLPVPRFLMPPSRLETICR